MAEIDPTSPLPSVDYDIVTGKARRGPSSTSLGRTDRSLGTSTGVADPTSPLPSVNYDIVSGKARRAPSSENVDSLGRTALGIEIKERFSSMRDAFLKLDRNFDGRITAKEIRSLCREWNIPGSEAERVIEAADLDANGTLDFDEFAKRFDPCEGEAWDDTAPAQAHPWDDRPCGGGGGGGWYNPEAEYDDRAVGAATRIQALQRGRQVRVEEDAPPTPSGSGSRAAASLRNDSLSQENAALKARIAQLEAELAARNDRETSLEARIRELEAELAERNDRETSLEGRIRELEATASAASADGDRSAARQRELERHLAAMQAASAEESARFKEQQRQFEAEAAESAKAAARMRELEAAAQADQAARAAAEAERPRAAVAVYGRANCPKTAAVTNQLTKSKVAFDFFDFDRDKSYMQALQASGFPPGGRIDPPIVVVNGQKAFWDEPDQEIAVHFPSMLINELRKLGIVAEQQVWAPYLLKDVTMDVEIQERFFNMQEAFLAMDYNQNGKISKKELIRKCEEWNIPRSEADRVIGEADWDKDGCIDFREFARRFGR